MADSSIFYHGAYNFILKSFGLELVSFLSRKSSGDPEFKRGRLGFYENGPFPAGTPRVWFHAASVGEATGAVPTLLALKKKLPGSGLFLSSGTPQGLKYARARLPEDISVLPFPLDFSKSVSRAIRALSPDLFVNFETEFWPNFYRELNARGIPALLLNGRMSGSSERLYRFLSPLFRPVFGQFHRMAMHSREDMERVIRVGVGPEKVFVLGSSKYDGLIDRARPERAEQWKELLHIGRDTPVIVGGSLRGAECVGLMRVFQELRGQSSNLLGIFAPRHMHNIPKMCEWLAKQGIAYDPLSEIEKGARRRTAPVVLVDRIGALFEIYSVGSLIFCGGSLVPVGGHNILEPAAWSKPVFYGPHLKKILHEHRILSDFGGSFTALDARDLLLQWKNWLGNLEALQPYGERAKEALQSLRGVVDNQVELILELLSNRMG